MTALFDVKKTLNVEARLTVRVTNCPYIVFHNDSAGPVGLCTKSESSTAIPIRVADDATVGFPGKDSDARTEE